VRRGPSAADTTTACIDVVADASRRPEARTCVLRRDAHRRTTTATAGRPLPLLNPFKDHVSPSHLGWQLDSRERTARLRLAGHGLSQSGGFLTSMIGVLTAQAGHTPEAAHAKSRSRLAACHQVARSRTGSEGQSCSVRARQISSWRGREAAARENDPPERPALARQRRRIRSWPAPSVSRSGRARQDRWEWRRRRPLPGND
jgi:hypothetical protein